MAAEGLRFTDAYATAPVCAPSRCSVLTGLHAGHATVRENPWGPGGQGALTERDFTFAEALGSRGYRTGIFGKWGLGPERPDQPSHPNSRGFEEFHGYIGHRHARSGDELTVRWRVTPARVTSDTTLACRATARHAGEDVTYLVRTVLG
ncbi:sulfatase-like hydrolase/transferase [Streptomyces sp. YS415]|nr:sulfatase-like hydrolase/transferase [Streptomyces sp. YS415]